jgi:regulator of nucleoside diphosphate kinase
MVRACARFNSFYRNRPMAIQQSIHITHRDAGRLARIVEDLLRRANSIEDGAEALHETLEGARHVSSAEIEADVVTMNSEVTIEDTSGARREIRLAYPREADPARGRVSVLSPMGNALLGSRVGWVVRFATPLGERSVRIAEIRFQPEAASQYDL